MLNKVLVVVLKVAIVFRLGVVTSILCSSASEAVGSSNYCRPPKMTLSKKCCAKRKIRYFVFNEKRVLFLFSVSKEQGAI